jgi:hypothetical protein
MELTLHETTAIVALLNNSIAKANYDHPDYDERLRDRVESLMSARKNIKAGAPLSEAERGAVALAHKLTKFTNVEMDSAARKIDAGK